MKNSYCCVDIINYSQSEMQPRHVHPHDWQHKKQHENQKSIEILKFCPNKLTYSLRISLLLIQTIRQNSYMVNKTPMTSRLHWICDVTENCSHSVDIIFYHQIELQSWNVNARDLRHKNRLENYQNILNSQTLS